MTDLAALAQDLEAAGLEEDQAQVYLRLLQDGPSKVGQLAPHLDRSRSTLYRLLDELADMGYVTKSLGRPTVYTPVEPDRMFERGIEAIDRSRERLSNVREARLGELEQLSSTTDETEETDHWRKMEGVDRILRVLHGMLEDATTSIQVLSNHELLASGVLPAVEEAWRVVGRRAHEDSIDTDLLLGLPDPHMERIRQRVVPCPALEVRRFSDKRPLNAAIVDGSELLMWVRLTPAGTLGKQDDIAVHTQANGSLAAYTLLFETLWRQAEPCGA